MRNKYLYITFFLITSCDTVEAPTKIEQPNKTSFSEKDDINFDSNAFFVIDSINSNDSLRVYDYQNLTAWGGLTLKYLNGKLQSIETIQNAELGFTKKSFLIDNYEIIKVTYDGHHAEWEKYQEKYPEEEFEWNPSKMTYLDTSFFVDYTLNTNSKSNLEKELKQEGKQIIQFIKEENINPDNFKTTNKRKQHQ